MKLKVSHERYNQTAAFDSHTVVRGNNKDKSILIERVMEHEQPHDTRGIVELEGMEHHNDLP